MIGKPESEPLAAAWRAAGRPATRSGCPEPDSLAALLAGSLPSTAAALVRDHLGRCTACGDEIRVLHALDAETHEIAQVIAARDQPRRLLASPWLAAAGIVLALGLVVVLAPPWGERSADDALRGEQVESTVPALGMQLDAAPEQLSWPPAAGVETYRVELFDQAGQPLWQSRTAHPAIALPAEVRVRMQPGHTYLWQVELGEDGGRTLGPYWFTLSPPR